MSVLSISINIVFDVLDNFLCSWIKNRLKVFPSDMQGSFYQYLDMEDYNWKLDNSNILKEEHSWYNLLEFYVN